MRQLLDHLSDDLILVGLGLAMLAFCAATSPTTPTTAVDPSARPAVTVDAPAAY